MTAVSISTDWSNVVPSSDVLFDEDILGDCDELMDITDIYNAAVVGGEDDDDDEEIMKEVMNGTCVVCVCVCVCYFTYKHI